MLNLTNKNYELIISALQYAIDKNTSFSEYQDTEAEDIICAIEEHLAMYRLDFQIQEKQNQIIVLQDEITLLKKQKELNA